jgi:acyl carrier protein
MTGIDEKLHRCFRAAFPDLTEGDIARATVDSVPEWDSLHTVILLALLEEAFEIRVAPRDYPSLRSYSSVRAYLDDGLDSPRSG